MKSNQPRKLRVSFALINYALSVFILTGRNIVVALTGNINFTSPFPALVDLTAALDELQAKAEAAAGRDREAIAGRNNAWNTAKDMFRQLANYVESHCQNDLAILLSSGFLATKTPAPIGPVSAPQYLRLHFTDMTGELLFHFAPVYGVTAGYLVQLAEDADGPFTDYVTTSKSRFTIKGLTPLKTYWVRVRATGASGAGPWSEPTCSLVL
jgi:hypothetical protein